EAFGDNMIGVLNSGALALMTSVGHRTGLFDTMDGLAPLSSTEIAKASGLNERYVREWLGAMVTGRIVECDASGAEPLFSLPAEHAAFLTREAAPDNIAAFAQYIPLLGSVEDKIVKCFKKGGGVAYSEYPRFHDVMAEDSGQSVLPALIDSILPLSEGLPARLAEGIDVMDIGCGSGKAVNLMAKTFPKSRFIGFDLSEAALNTARNEARELGLTNANFAEKDLTYLDIENSYDLITAFDAIHDQKAPDKVLGSIFAALRRNGVFLMQDIGASSEVHKNIDHPVGTFLYAISCLHCMTVSMAQGGPGLGAMWGKELAVEMLKEAGFRDIEVKKLEHDFQNYYYIVEK
ncbi:MAG: class I SAM-dependent methyltransferase, partial [Thermodesulfobacteriota bacterium]